MIKNYLIVALRNLRRNYVFTSINIIGLTLGLAINAIIVLYLVNELTYDRFNKDYKQIYRLHQEVNYGGSARGLDPRVNAPFGPYLQSNFPNVINQARVSSENMVRFLHGESIFDEKIFYADSTFFQLFTYRFILGDSESALKKPFSLVLTKNMAKKYFGKANPVGKTLTTSKGRLYTVTGVIENVPENSHFKFDMLSSFTSLPYIEEYNGKIDGWGTNYVSFYTYIKTSKGYDISALESELPRIADTYLSDNAFLKYSFTFQHLKDIYLYHSGKGSVSRVILFGVIGLLVLLIPCINYMNLNTAESLKRLKEVGVRKVLGSTRKQLVTQFLVESMLISLFSLVLALTLAEIIIPIFNTLLSKNLAFAYLDHWQLSVGYIVIALLAGLLAGAYPALYLSSFSSSYALKGKFAIGAGRSIFQSAFTIAQFAISIFLICCTGIILMQIKYSNGSDLGFKKDNILSIKLPYNTTASQNVIAERLSEIPEVKRMAIASGLPLEFTMFGRFKFDEANSKKLVLFLNIDHNFFDLLDLKLIEGRNFINENSAENNKVIINETLKKELGWDDPIGKTFFDSESSTEYTIVGVMKDFHNRTFHEKIFPFALIYSNDIKSIVSIICETNGENLSNIENLIQNKIESIYPELELTIKYFDQIIEDEYSEEIRIGYMFLYFAIIAIFITLIGLYGMALFIARQRTKEIGIRKVFGSSTREIVSLLTRQFLKVVVIALAIAIPAAWYYTKIWLQSFVYQVDNRWVVYTLASVIVVAIAAITIISQSVRAANSNPIDAIRYE
jgi:putative ABC transport system permease protein